MLSKKTKYAFHALTYLGKQQEKTPVLIAEIAEKTRVPKKFLESILLDLKKAGILTVKWERVEDTICLKILQMLNWQMSFECLTDL